MRYMRKLKLLLEQTYDEQTDNVNSLSFSLDALPENQLFDFR